LPWPLVILAGVALSALIETTQFGLSQYVGHAYRSADIDDVIVNTAGTVTGLALFGVAAAGVRLAKWLQGERSAAI
jgi:glycopeptide antibiotics resistance protein